MEDKTALYMVIIVGIIAVVGLIIVLLHSSSPQVNVPADSNNQLTGLSGNAVYSGSSNNSGALNIFGEVFFAIFLIGIAGYLYYRNE